MCLYSQKRLFIIMKRMEIRPEHERDYLKSTGHGT